MTVFFVFLLTTRKKGEIDLHKQELQTAEFNYVNNAIKIIAISDVNVKQKFKFISVIGLIENR